MKNITKKNVLIVLVIVITIVFVVIGKMYQTPKVKNTFNQQLSTSIALQNIDDVNYVNTVELIKLAQFYDIKISDKFVEATTQQQMMQLRDYVYSEIKKKDPTF